MGWPKIAHGKIYIFFLSYHSLAVSLVCFRSNSIIPLIPEIFLQRCPLFNPLCTGVMVTTADRLIPKGSDLGFQRGTQVTHRFDFPSSSWASFQTSFLAFFFSHPRMMLSYQGEVEAPHLCHELSIKNVSHWWGANPLWCQFPIIEF